MTHDPVRDVLLDPDTAYRLWAPSYPASAHTPLMRVEERAVLALLPDLDGATVIDVGCGTGRYLALARARGARHAIGIDPSRDMLGLVRVRGARLARACVEALPVGNEVADVVICALTLGHVASLRRAFAELARVTRDKGVLICSELHPVGASLGWRRTFTANGKRFAVQDARHSLDDWLEAGLAAGWSLDARAEPMLQPGDVPTGQVVDPAALGAPSALVLRFVRASSAARGARA